MFQWDKVTILIYLFTTTSIELNPLDCGNPSKKFIVRSS